MIEWILRHSPKCIRDYLIISPLKIKSLNCFRDYINIKAIRSYIFFAPEKRKEDFFTDSWNSAGR